jgi:phosphoribosylaminoimidazolecarboxamide formyltransferase/IMP cyclohydrolase
MSLKKIKNALVSVYHKDKLDQVLHILQQLDVRIFSTGGTYDFIKGLGIKAETVESQTGYPSILGGRVKTLHPKVFGGILARNDIEKDLKEAEQYGIPLIDLVIVDLYPFEETVSSGAAEKDIIEKIDIGGISLIRASAKNFNDVLIISSREQYVELIELLKKKDGCSDLHDRKRFATYAFGISSDYDTAIFNYFNRDAQFPFLKISEHKYKELRYGENPHQKGIFFGDLSKLFVQLHGKELSYNNLVDIDAAVSLVGEVSSDFALAIIKHTNACGMASGKNMKEAYLKALEADNVSAFGGVLASSQVIDLEVAEEINKLFFEILIAPDFAPDALSLLKSKKNRILLKQNEKITGSTVFKSLLNGTLMQDKDLKVDSESDLKYVTKRRPTPEEIESLLFASKVCKHTKSNTIVLAKKGQLIASGVGQTSRVDALNQAVAKAGHFGLSLNGAVLASDAFFPFADCVEIADKAGIKAVIQPGGSVRDQDSIDYCDAHGMAMVFTGYRHFKH